jgi:outer membrane protein assembly factor BamB
MKTSKSKTIAAAFALLLALSIVASLTLSPETLGVPVQPPAGSSVPSYAQLNVAPNPAGIGQTVTVNMYLLVPLLTSESAVNMTVVQKDPDGVTKTLGPFTSDATGGTYTTMVPDKTGEYTFQFFYGGQTMFNGVIELPSQSDVVTLVVQDEPIPRSAYPITPLPTEWWQTPITAENVQEWYKIAGNWLGYGTVTFAETGGYNLTGNYNPYTESVLAGHVLWTKIWAGGGVSGLSGNEESGHYWSTSQYWPKYAPVIINGIMYSDWKVESNSYQNGIVAVDLYTGETLWRINTTSSLRGGMVTQWKTINAYGVIGPYIWTTGGLPASETGGRLIGTPARYGFEGYTPGVYSSFMNTTGTQWNMYSGLTGQYVLSVVNGTSMTIVPDEYGHMIGYYINSTVGTMNVYGAASEFGTQPLTGQVNITAGAPVLCCYNMSQALGNSWGWGPSQNTVIDWGLGVMWAKPVWNNISGVPISPALSINGITGDTVVMTAGFTFGQGFGGEQNGWLVVGAQDAKDGHLLWCKNFTENDYDVFEPFTRTALIIWDGLVSIGNLYNADVIALNANTGELEWSTTLEGDNGAEPQIFDVIGGIEPRNGPGVTFYFGFGGDIWCLNNTNGNLLWYTNTTKLIGDPGIETPYTIWPLWTFSCTCASNDVAYFAIGHEYNPPLFHGAQLLALNITDGTLIWSELGMSIESTSIAYGILLSRNAYDNMIYAFGKGPSSTTVTAPDIGVTIETPITITGTVMDVSPGTLALVQPDVTRTKQNEVALRFPNGVPCVSDESQSKWMEYVYQQQPMPTNATGVEVILDVIDANGNYYNIGTATTDTSGTFAFTWTPIIPGEFTVIATFAGSNSYYGSCAEAHFYASDVPAPTPEPTPEPASVADIYFVPMSVALLIVIVIVGAIIVLMLRRR